MAMRLPELNKFCCCIPLRSGVFIIGYVSLLVALSFICFASWSIYKIQEYAKNYENNLEPDFPTVEVMQSTSDGLYILFTITILIFLFCCIINVILIVGIHKINSHLVWYYLPLSIVLVVLTLIHAGHSFYFLTLSRICPLLLWSGILCYFIMVVRSMYLNMAEEERRFNNGNYVGVLYTSS